MRNLFQDLRFAARILLKNPTVTVISVLTLGLGIGAGTAVFSVVDAMLLTPPPFDEPDRLVRLFTSKPSAGWSRMTVAWPDVRDWSEQSSAFAATGIFWYEALNLSGADHPERVVTVRASASVLTVLGVTPTLGRGHDPADDTPGGGHLVLLSDSYWWSRFGADPAVVGTTVSIDGAAHEILGVLPPSMELAFGQFQAWAPFTCDPDVYGRGIRYFRAIARLRPGLTVADAAAELEAIAERQAVDFPETNRGHGVTVATLTDVLLGRGARPLLLVLTAAVLFVLLIAAVNVANLLLATAGSREREFAVRAALGAARPRLFRQVLTESALLAICGGALGLAVAHVGVDLLAAGLDATVGTVGEIVVNRRTLMFSALLLGVTTLGFGLPAASRASSSRFTELIRTGTRSVLGGRRARIRRDILVVAQVAMALALLMSAALMIRSMTALRAVDPGFEIGGLLTMRAALPEQRYPTDTERAEFIERAVAEIRALPGVDSAAAVSTIPLTGSNANSSLTIEDHPISDPADKIFVGSEVATDGYLETLRIPIIDGRAFDAADRRDTAGVIVINRHMAEHFWPEERAIGKRVKFGPSDSDSPWLEVIGVMGDYRQTSLDTPIRFETLRPQTQATSPDTTFIIRTHGAPDAATDSIRQTIWKQDPDLALYAVSTMESVASDNSRSHTDVASLLSAFGLVALVLAVGGLYGMMSHMVAGQTHEIGLRIALGAETRRLLLAVVGRSAGLVGLGVVFGAVLAWLLAETLKGMLFEVSSLDPMTWIAVIVGLLWIGIVAGLPPALRAARIEPAEALRCD